MDMGYMKKVIRILAHDINCTHYKNVYQSILKIMFFQQRNQTDEEKEEDICIISTPTLPIASNIDKP